MMPWLVRAEQEIQSQLLDEAERAEYFGEFLVDGYLRGDAVTRAQAYEIRFRNGNLTQNQWRFKENENPLPDGLGDQYFVSTQLASVNPLPGEELLAPVTRRETIQAPIQPGEPPQLVAVKSAAMEVRCSNCDQAARGIGDRAIPDHVSALQGGR